MIVLDTHIFLWYAVDAPELNQDLKTHLQADPGLVWVPSICFWEAMLLAEKGRIELNGPPGERLREFLTQSGFNEYPLTSEIAILSRTLSFQHDDPADRIIAATAHHLQASLATADKALRQLDWAKLAF